MPQVAPPALPVAKPIVEGVQSSSAPDVSQIQITPEPASGDSSVPSRYLRQKKHPVGLYIGGGGAMLLAISLFTCGAMGLWPRREGSTAQRRADDSVEELLGGDGPRIDAEDLAAEVYEEEVSNEFRFAPDDDSVEELLGGDGPRIEVVNLAAKMSEVGLSSEFRFSPDWKLVRFVTEHVKSGDDAVYGLLGLPASLASVTPPSPFFAKSDSSMNFVTTRVNFRLHGTGLLEVVAFPQVSLCLANLLEPWFLTKDDSLQQCNSLREASMVMQLGGTLYFPESSGTQVFIVSTFDDKTRGLLIGAPTQFTMDVVFDGLRYGREIDWGFYNHRGLVMWDWNSDRLTISAGGLLGPPQYFRPAGVRSPEYVVANIVAVILRDQSMIPIAGYRRPYDDRELVLPRSATGQQPGPPSTDEQIRRFLTAGIWRCIWDDGSGATDFSFEPDGTIATYWQGKKISGSYTVKNGQIMGKWGTASLQIRTDGVHLWVERTHPKDASKSKRGVATLLGPR